MVLSDGCAGLAAAIETIYPRARHQRCWVHKMRNLRDGVRRRDQARISAMPSASIWPATPPRPATPSGAFAFIGKPNIPA